MAKERGNQPDPYWLELIRIMERQRRMFQSALPISDKLAKDMTRRFEFFERLGLKAIAGVDSLNSVVSATQLEAMSEIAKRLAEAVQGPARDAARSVEPLLEMQRRLGESVAAIQYPAVSSFFVQWEKTLQAAEARGVSRDVFAESIGGLSKAADASTENEFEESVQDVSGVIESQAESLPRSRVSFDALIQIWFMIIIFLFQYSIDEASDTKIHGRLDVLEGAHREVIATIEGLRPDDEDPLMYRVVARRIRLRAGPSTQSEVIRWLEPGTLLGLLKRKGQWLRVEVFDPVKGEPQVGWVYNRHIRDAMDASPAEELL